MSQFKLFNLRRICKIAIAVSIAGAIGEFTSTRLAIASTALEPSVSMGVLSENQILTSDENLTVGRDWAVYDLTTEEYIGMARVIDASQVQDPCNCKYKSTLHLETFSEENYRQFLLVRPIPNHPESSRITSVTFDQLPSSVQQDMIRFWHIQLPGYADTSILNILHRGDFKSIDLDIDNSSDILYSRVIDGLDFPGLRQSSIYVDIDSQWVIKFSERSFDRN
jgi:hypothetical protein